MVRDQHKVGRTLSATGNVRWFHGVNRSEPDGEEHPIAPWTQSSVKIPSHDARIPSQARVPHFFNSSIACLFVRQQLRLGTPVRVHQAGAASSGKDKINGYCTLRPRASRDWLPNPHTCHAEEPRRAVGEVDGEPDSTEGGPDEELAPDGEFCILQAENEYCVGVEEHRDILEYIEIEALAVDDSGIIEYVQS